MIKKGRTIDEIIYDMKDDRESLLHHRREFNKYLKAYENQNDDFVITRGGHTKSDIVYAIKLINKYLRLEKKNCLKRSVLHDRT